MRIESIPISIAKVIALSSLVLASCTKEAPVVIEPGKFGEEWPTAIRGNLIKNKRCIVDSINGKATRESLKIKRGQPLIIGGWTFSADAGTPSDLYIQLVSPALTYTALTQHRVERPDVVQIYKLDPNWKPGFELQASQNAEPGEYRVEILLPTREGVTQCQTQTFVKIE